MELIHAINEWAAAIGMRQVEADETGGFTLLFDGAGTGGAAFGVHR